MFIIHPSKNDDIFIKNYKYKLIQNIFGFIANNSNKNTKLCHLNCSKMWFLK